MNIRYFYIISIIVLVSLFSCTKLKNQNRKITLFIGIDVSGSFTTTKIFKDSIKFLSYYIYGHINGYGDLAKPKDLYVGGIGGDIKEDTQAFFPIHDFIGLKPSKIQKKLFKEFSKQHDNLTDFNTFFDRIALLVKQKNLHLSPINIVLITDGVPEVVRGKRRIGKAKKQAYSQIDVEPLEYLSRNVSLRVLYPSSRIGNEWIRYVPRRRVKLWTVEDRVMYGWHNQLKRGKKALWKWIKDNIDRRIYTSRVK